jgi:hypothetical protein
MRNDGSKLKLSMSVYRSLILALCVLCTGCAINDPYPDNWSPAAVGEAECPDISGTYEDELRPLAGGQWAT